MRRKVLNTENFEILDGLKAYCERKKINYPNLSNKLSGRKTNDSSLLYVDELDFNAFKTYKNNNGDEFEIINLFNCTVYGGKKEKRALVILNNKLYFLSKEQTEKYNFQLKDIEIEVLKYYKENPSAKLKDICEIFNISIGTCDRIINILNK
jgi:hypothetical protein